MAEGLACPERFHLSKEGVYPERFHLSKEGACSENFQLNKGLVYQYDSIEYHIYYVKAEEGRTIIALPSDSEFSLSGNNEDGFILTIKKACDTKRNREYFLLNVKRGLTEDSRRIGRM